MALATSSDLQTAVASWLGRVGDTFVTANVADWIALCESRIHYGASEDSPFPSDPLRVRAMEASAPLIIKAVSDGGTVGGTANAITLSGVSAPALGSTYSFTALSTNTGAVTAAAVAVKQSSALSALTGGEIVAGALTQIYHDGTQFVLMPGTANVPLPSNYLAMRALYLATTPRVQLEFRASAQMDDEYSTAAGQPNFFTIEGDTLRFNTPPDTAYVAQCLYYKKFGALASVSTNWLLTNKPDVYLYGTLLEANIFLDSDPGIVKYGGLYRAACNGLQNQDALDRHSGGPMRIRPDGGTP